MGSSGLARSYSSDKMTSKCSKILVTRRNGRTGYIGSLARRPSSESTSEHSTSEFASVEEYFVVLRFDRMSDDDGCRQRTVGDSNGI